MRHIRTFSVGFRHISLAIAGIVSAIAVMVAPTASAATQANASSTLTNTQKRHIIRYVAMGDSVAAGLGLLPLVNASSADTACGRSSQAYASTVAAGMNAKLSKHNIHVTTVQAACQEAAVANLTQPQQQDSVTLPSQINQAYAAGTPTLVTLTIGANDLRWADFINACFSAASCDTPANTATARAYMDAVSGQVTAALRDIHSKSGSVVPFVVVTGYYQPVSAQCVNATLTGSEVAWLLAQRSRFNSVLRAATEQAGWYAKFAPVDFTGHDICSADPWVQRPGVPTEPAALHPNARGQQAIGESILKTIGLY